MSRFALALLVCLLPACSPGSQGPQGETGPQGAPGAPGANGQDANADGSRLKPRFWVGEDGSKIAMAEALDTERGEVCRPTPHDGEILCLPPVVDATAFKTWVDATCDGDYGHPRVYAPASLPEGTSVVSVLGGPLDGEWIMRAEEVPSLYHRGPGGDGPCEPFVVTPDGAFQPPFYRWPLFDSAAFVGGEILPE